MTNDDTLQQTVMAELEWNYAVPAANIVVTAKNGVVTLGGYVDSYAGKLEAQTAAARVRDVQSVANEIAVHLPLTITSSDEEIRVAAIDRLAWNSFIPKDSITVKVERRWVTLTGRVNAWYQKEAAARDSAAIKAANLSVAVSFGKRARLVVSCQGSRSSRARAETTLSSIPFFSSPSGANKKSSNSGPSRQADCECTI
jgi:osmotically-inducible protein OsmY